MIVQLLNFNNHVQYTLVAADSCHDSVNKNRGYNCNYKGKRPQSRRLTASLFINAHEIIKEGHPVGDMKR
eukprot:1148146-Pelagomonas_calceolata.AAC.3